LGQALLQIPDAGEVFVELVAVPDAKTWLHLLGLVPDRVEDALAVAQTSDLRLDVLGTPVEEQPGEHAARVNIRRHRGAAAGPGDPVLSQVQAGEARLTSELLGRELVQGDGIAEAGPSLRVRGGGQEAAQGIVAGADLRMREPGSDREVVAEVLEDLQIGR